MESNTRFAGRQRRPAVFIVAVLVGIIVLAANGLALRLFVYILDEGVNAMGNSLLGLIVLGVIAVAVVALLARSAHRDPEAKKMQWKDYL